MTEDARDRLAYSDPETHIADLLACRKKIIGVAAWQPEVSKSSKYNLRATLEADIETDFRLVLCMQANTQSSFQRGAIVITCNNVPIERMVHRTRKPHTNPLHNWVPKELRGQEIPGEIPRYYPWQENRRLGWPQAAEGNLKVCTTVEEKLENYMDSIKYFLDRTNVIFDVPPLEFEARLL